MVTSLSTQELLNIAHARALLYDFFYGVLTFEELPKREKVLLEQVSLLQNMQNTESFKQIMDFLRSEGIEGVKAEHSRLFSFPFEGRQVGLHLSHFYHNFLAGEALLEAKTLLKKTKMRLNAKDFRETEEHLGFWCGFLHYLITEEIKIGYDNPKEYKEEDLQEGNAAFSQEVFSLGSGAFFGMCAEIQNRPDSLFYRSVAESMEGFLSFEESYYALSSIPYKRRELAKAEEESYDHRKNRKRSFKERTQTASPIEELLIKSSKIDPKLLSE